MKNLFDQARANEIKVRVARLKPESKRQWGKMTPAQAVAHCAVGLEMGVGDTNPPRVFIGRIIGVAIKKKVVRDDEPFRRNSPTAKQLIVEDDRDLGKERERLVLMIDRFASGGPAGCTTHPHSFFGRLTPEEWAVLMYKHLDHHLRQFGV